MSNRQLKFQTLLTLAAMPLLFAGGLRESAAQKAESFPSKPVRIVVPFPPGGGADILARIVSQHMTESFGQPVIVENRAGAGSMIGIEAVAKAPADGHTLLIAVTAFVINPSLYRKVNYDPIRDFSPVSLGIRFPYLLVVHPSLPVKTVKELIALAKTHPGKITYASSGTGLSNHLAGEMFKDAAGIDIVHIPYKGGGPALTEMLGGQVSMTFGTVLQTLPQVRAGKLRALGVSSAKRVSFAADLPTIAETGLPGFEAIGWYSFAVAAGTPAPIQTRLNQELVRILQLPAVNERLHALGTEPHPSTMQEARDFYASELARWTKVVVRAGLKGSE
jgi:hypothetical protein